MCTTIAAAPSTLSPAWPVTARAQMPIAAAAASAIGLLRVRSGTSASTHTRAAAVRLSSVARPPMVVVNSATVCSRSRATATAAACAADSVSCTASASSQTTAATATGPAAERKLGPVAGFAEHRQHRQSEDSDRGDVRDGADSGLCRGGLPARQQPGKCPGQRADQQDTCREPARGQGHDRRRSAQAAPPAMRRAAPARNGHTGRPLSATPAEADGPGGPLPATASVNDQDPDAT